VPAVGADHEHASASLLRNVPDVVRSVARDEDVEYFQKMLRELASLGSASESSFHMLFGVGWLGANRLD